ncbi:hypothetical protein DPEC_G00351750 [Dallia pectoralis]|uniref:Uncharacterized protein n=1 Tax=Dallia pectoralis TaxID=75939 RepID=A0ACC2F222_DALPE|nr:hypothetical protein DPEC_G00351750 [Dallia pectoralis]
MQYSCSLVETNGGRGWGMGRWGTFDSAWGVCRFGVEPRLHFLSLGNKPPTQIIERKPTAVLTRVTDVSQAQCHLEAKDSHPEQSHLFRGLKLLAYGSTQHTEL